MNFVKSLFILLSPAVLLVIVIQAILGLVYSSNSIIYLGVLMSALPLLLFLLYLLVFRNIARTSLHLAWVSIPSFAGYCLVLFVFIKTSNIHLVNAMVYSLAAFFITFLYIYWYSNNGREEVESLTNTHQLPEFSLKDTSGKTVLSSTFKGHKTLIFFFRGNWCPLCMAQIDEIAAFYQKFEEDGIHVVFISPQAANKTEELAKRFDLKFKFYVDENNQAAKGLGILHKFGLPMGFQALGYESDSVYPTVIATDENGEIIYNDQTKNYRIRPLLEELTSIFQ